MPNNGKRTRVHWLIQILNGYEYKAITVAREMEKVFPFVGCPTKGGTTERARQLLTKAKQMGYVESNNGWWYLTNAGKERLTFVDNRPFHGKCSGHKKLF